MPHALQRVQMMSAGTPILSRLRACGPVIPGIPRLARVDPARYALGRYGDQVRYGDGILFLFGRAHALATPKGGGPCPLDGRQHGILDSTIIVSLPDILFNFAAPIGVR